MLSNNAALCPSNTPGGGVPGIVSIDTEEGVVFAVERSEADDGVWVLSETERVVDAGLDDLPTMPAAPAAAAANRASSPPLAPPRTLPGGVLPLTEEAPVLAYRAVTPPARLDANVGGPGAGVLTLDAGEGVAAALGEAETRRLLGM